MTASGGDSPGVSGGRLIEGLRFCIGIGKKESLVCDVLCRLGAGGNGPATRIQIDENRQFSLAKSDFLLYTAGQPSVCHR
jgi:hypothetical protein